MASNYWIKLYHEILDDPKMGRLDDHLFRRVVELLLIAGETDKGGVLPPIVDIAWRLRIPENEVQEYLDELLEIDFVHIDDDAWIITKFADRQAPVCPAERKRRQRVRDKKALYYNPPSAHCEGDQEADPGGSFDEFVTIRDKSPREDVTKCDQKHDGNIAEKMGAGVNTGVSRLCHEDVTIRDTDTDTDTDTEDVVVDSELEKGQQQRPPPRLPFSRVVQAWESSVGPITAGIAEDLGDLADECEKHRSSLPPGAGGADLEGNDWVIRAITEARKSTPKAFNTKYIQKILDRWKVEGFQMDRSNNGGVPGGVTSHLLPEEFLREVDG